MPLRSVSSLFWLAILALSLPAQASPWDDKVVQWRKESATISMDDLPILEKQAEQGDVRAVYLLQRELGNPRHDYKSRPGAASVGRWATKLAEGGNPLGMVLLCNLYSDGRGGLPQDGGKALAWCRKGWEKGSNSAAVILGWIYSNGKGVSKDDAEAEAWFRKGAEAGNGQAMASLGAMYYGGKGVSKDDSEAVKWYRKGAEAGDEHAMTNLGVMYRDGLGIPKDEAEAAKWFRKGAEAGDGNAMSSLGGMYRDGRGIPKDEAEAVKWFRKGADAGNTFAMSNLGYMYGAGKGVPKDYVEATKWYRKGADAGDEHAMTNLGVMYRDGRGIPKDEAEAVKWFRKGADKGNEHAMTNLGVMYRNGRGTPTDYVEAVKWFRKSAEAKNGLAMSNLGHMYSTGKGVPKDDAEAVKWYRMGAKAGDGQSMVNLGAMYQLGEEVLKDATKAAKWYRKGAEVGDGTAMANLANCYQEGRGVPKSHVEAARWYAKALQTDQKNTYNNGETADKRARRELDEMIAQGQITDAAVRQEVAAVFKPAPQAKWAALPPTTGTENTEIGVHLSDAGGGIGDVQLFIDGTLVDRNASRDFGIEVAKILPRRSFTVKLPEGKHEIRIRAYAAENIGNFSELTGTIISTWKKISKPKLHLIAVGVDEFAEPSLNLKYAQADARAIYDSLSKQIGGLYDKGETSLLLGRKSAGKQAIINAIRTVQKNAQFDDVFVFYAASHGKNYENPL